MDLNIHAHLLGEREGKKTQKNDISTTTKMYFMIIITNCHQSCFFLYLFFSSSVCCSMITVLNYKSEEANEVLWL